MTSLDKALAANAPLRPTRISLVRDQLRPADRATLDAALVDPTISAERLCAALASLGHRVAPSTVRRWRHEHVAG